MAYTGTYKKCNLTALLLYVLAACILNAAQAKAGAQTIKDTLVINEDNGEYPLYRHLYIYKTDKAVTPAFVYDSISPATFIKPSILSYNDIQHQANYYWLFFTVKNNLPNDEVFYCQLNHPQLYSVMGYLKNDTGFAYMGKSGYAYPFNQKLYHYYDNVFPVHIKSGQVAFVLLLVNISSGYNPYFAPQLSSANTFKDKEQRFYVVNGVITGIMITALLLNLFLGYSLKEKLHFLYAVYIICVLYEILLSQGLDSQYIYPNSTNKLSILRYIVPCTGIVLLAYIMQWFLNQTRKNSWFKIFVDVTNYTLISITFFYAILHFALAANKNITSVYQTCLACLCILQMIFVLASAVEKARQGNRLAWFYIAAILCIFAGILEYGLIFLGVTAAESSVIKHPNDMQVGLVVETLVVFFGIVYRYNLYKKERELLLIEINTHQQKLINRIVDAQEEERKRIAEDLHDDVGATLSALAMHISNLPVCSDNEEESRKHYKQSMLLSNKAVSDIRTIAHNLLPKDFNASGLFGVLEKRIEDVNMLNRVRFTLVTEGDEKKLAEVFAITVYRVINELVNNILKHSLASEAAIQLLIEDKTIQIMAEDDGIGFNRELTGNGIGLKNIKGRVEFLKGEMHIDSNNNGTQTVIHIPL